MTMVTLDLDDDIVADLRAEAARTGLSLDQVASTRLRGRGPSIFDRLRERPGLDEDEGTALAVEEVRAVREERHSGQ